MPYTAGGRISRRILVKCAAGLAATLSAPSAFASEGPNVLTLPCSIAYMRFSKTGVDAITQDDRTHWEQMSRRLGGVIERMEPFSYSSVLPMTAPVMDGGAAAALQARMTASRAGYDYVLLYSVLHPAPPPKDAYSDVSSGESSRRRRLKRGKWLFTKLKSAKLNLSPPPPESFILGEAHLIEALSGNVVVSTWASAPPNRAVGVFRDKRAPEAEIMYGLIADMERRLQMLAAQNYRNGKSIAD